MYGGRYDLARYSLGVGEWAIEAGETFSAALGGLAGGAVPMDAGAVFTGELSGTVRGVLVMDAALEAGARLLSRGRLGKSAGAKDIPGGLLAAAVLTTAAEAGIQSRSQAVFQLTIPPGGGWLC